MRISKKSVVMSTTRLMTSTDSLTGHVNGTAYDLHGPPDASVLVLVHGLGLCREIWNDYIADLSKAYRVLNYDLVGHGDSLPSIETASLRVYAKQILDLMDALHINHATIVGFSIGGMINRRFALDYPDRVSALIILNSPHERGEFAQRQVEARAARVHEQGALATMDEALKRWFTADFLDSNPLICRKVIEWRQRADSQSYAQAAWVLAAGVRELTGLKLIINAPCLVATCQYDTGSTPAMSASIAAQFDGAELHIVPGLQHLGLLEKPALFISLLLDFLARASV